MQRMTEKELAEFFQKISKAETYDDKNGNNAWGFNKGVRTTLRALGYNPIWVETKFWDEYEEFIKTSKTEKILNKER